MTATDPDTVTQLLRDWRDGDPDALDRLMPLVYEELRRMARGLMRSERREHTLEATALVHEVYARLVGTNISAQDRGHFLGIAASAMRQILTDHARAHRRAKRGGGAIRVTLGDDTIAASGSPEELLLIDEALEKLDGLDPRKRRAVELHLFAGMTYPEIGRVLDISVPTVQRDMRMALAWIRSEMGGERRS